MKLSCFSLAKQDFAGFRLTKFSFFIFWRPRKQEHCHPKSLCYSIVESKIVRKLNLFSSSKTKFASQQKLHVCVYKEACRKANSSMFLHQCFLRFRALDCNLYTTKISKVTERSFHLSFSQRTGFLWSF